MEIVLPVIKDVEDTVLEVNDEGVNLLDEVMGLAKQLNIKIVKTDVRGQDVIIESVADI